MNNTLKFTTLAISATVISYNCVKVYQNYEVGAPVAGDFASQPQVNGRHQENSRTRSLRREKIMSGFDDAVAWAESQKIIPARMTAFEELLQSIQNFNSEDCKNALGKLVFSSSEPSENSNLRIALLRQLARTEPEATLRFIDENELPTGYKIAVYGSVAAALMKNTPETAMRFLDALPPGILYNTTYKSIAEEIARTSWEEAVAFADAFPDDDQFRRSCLENVAKVMAEEDLNLAMINLQQVPDGKFKNLLKLEVSKRLADISPSQGLQMALELEPGMREESIEYASSLFAASSPSEMAVRIGETENGAARDMLFLTLAGTWSRYDPLAAAEWFAKIPDVEEVDGEHDAHVLGGSELAQNIFKIDDNNGVEFLEKLEPGPVRDGIVNNILNNESVSDPERSFNLALTIGSERLRIAQAKRVLSRISNENPILAVRMLESANIGKSEALQLRGFLSK